MSRMQELPAFGAMTGRIRDRVYLFDNGFIFTSAWVYTGETARFPGVLLLTVDGRPFELASGPERIESSAAAIRPRVSRSLDARERLLLSVHVEPAHAAYAAFRAIAGSGLQPLPPARFEPLRESMRACHDGALDLASAESLFERLLGCAVPAMPQVRPIADRRIIDTLASLRRRPDRSLGELACELGLSYDRLSHLFSEQVGLPLKSYQLWRKVKRATMLLDSQRTLTEIAHEVGFSDSAHLTRTYSHFFGIRPSYLMNSDCVQVIH